MDLSYSDRVRGSLLGGAVGDALGAPIEFDSLAKIRKRFGPEGLRDFAPAHGRLGAITDDTQMTLFTGEGVIRAHNRFLNKGLSHVPTVVHHAYLRWLKTQGEPLPVVSLPSSNLLDGWLGFVPDLQARRAPGNTCLNALRGGRLGTIEEPLNDSKGCGGVMRIAPVGLALGIDDPFQAGAEIAAITHGHPSGFLAAGFLAHVIRQLLAGEPLAAAIVSARAELVARPSHGEVLEAVDGAVAAADGGPVSPGQVEKLGAGWVAEEALAISLYCALVHRGDFEAGVLLAVNHSGDSDSTGAITGNLMGAMLGVDAIPDRWLEVLELSDEVEEIADDMRRHFEEPRVEMGPDELERYPGW